MVNFINYSTNYFNELVDSFPADSKVTMFIAFIPFVSNIFAEISRRNLNRSLSDQSASLNKNKVKIEKASEISNKFSGQAAVAIRLLFASILIVPSLYAATAGLFCAAFVLSAAELHHFYSNQDISSTNIKMLKQCS